MPIKTPDLGVPAVLGWLRDALLDAVALVLPVDCVGCGAPDRALCLGCRRRLSEAPGHVRLVAGVRCDAPFVYDGLPRTIMLAVKVRGQTELLQVLASPAATILVAARRDVPDALIVRIPGSRSGYLRRGFDPVEMFVRRSGAGRTPVLRRTRRRPHADTSGASAGQKSLTAVQRVDATVGTLRAEHLRDLDRRPVILVDDVVTTGVTLAEGIRAVRAAGGTVARCVAMVSVDEAQRAIQR